MFVGDRARSHGVYASKFSWKFSYSCIHCLLACGRASETVRGNRRRIRTAREKRKKRKRESERESSGGGDERWGRVIWGGGGEERIRKNNKAGVDKGRPCNNVTPASSPT